MMTIARRNRIGDPVPRRTICCNRRPSSSLSREVGEVVGWRREQREWPAALLGPPGS
jgi:hypothetical protein